jgi:hypothetical protein
MKLLLVVRAFLDWWFFCEVYQIAEGAPFNFNSSVRLTLAGTGLFPFLARMVSVWGRRAMWCGVDFNTGSSTTGLYSLSLDELLRLECFRLLSSTCLDLLRKEYLLVFCVETVCCKPPNSPLLFDLFRLPRLSAKVLCREALF